MTKVITAASYSETDHYFQSAPPGHDYMHHCRIQRTGLSTIALLCVNLAIQKSRYRLPKSTAFRPE